MPTANYDLNLMFENSLQKELIINENFFTLDSLIICKAIDFIDSLPSDNLQNGNTWVISTNSVESLQNRRGNIVLYSGNNGFKFIEPKNGMVVFISSKKSIIVYENNNWVNFTLEQVANNSDLGDTSTFAKLTDLQGFLKSSDAAQFLKSSDLSTMAKLSDLTSLAKASDLITLAKLTDLAPFVKSVDLSSFAKLTDLMQYQKLTDVLKINDSTSSTSSVYSSKKVEDAILLAISSVNISQSSSGGSSVVSNFVGDYKQSAIADNHNGWLVCNGSAVLRSKYQNLFTLIGSSFGAGDGSTTFNLPDFRGRIFGAIGQGSGLANRVIGQSIGTETHTLSINEIPSHKHQLFGANGSGSGAARMEGALIANGTAITSAYTGKTSDCSGAMNDIGGGVAHNNMQPTLFGGNIFIFSGVIA